MVRRTTKAALILAVMVSMAAAVTMAAAGVAAAHPAGVAAAKPKPSPTPTPTPTPTSTAAYTVTNLGSLGGGESDALAINNNGQVTDRTGGPAGDGGIAGLGQAGELAVAIPT